MSDPNDSVDDIPSDSLSMSSESPGQDDTDGPAGEENPPNAEGGSYFGKAQEWVISHPVQAAGFGTVAAIAVLPAMVATPVLAAVGFGANGVAAGSMAAGVQSGMGSVMAPSLFATLQSAGAGGYGVAAVHQAVSAATLTAGGIGAYFTRRAKKEDNGEAGQGDEGVDDGSGGEKKGGSDGSKGNEAGDNDESKAENADFGPTPKAHL